MHKNFLKYPYNAYKHNPRYFMHILGIPIRFIFYVLSFSNLSHLIKKGWNGTGSNSEKNRDSSESL